jgi:hypothetical protein
MGGWMNWAFNVYPRIRPALNNFYPKLKGRCDSTSPIWVNNSIQEDFSWAIKTLEGSSGICLLRSLYWGADEATLTIFCDACPEGMGFWYPKLNVGFYSPTPWHEHPDLIFYFEALCVHFALFDAHRRTASKGTGRFIIYTYTVQGPGRAGSRPFFLALGRLDPGPGPTLTLEMLVANKKKIQMW